MGSPTHHIFPLCFLGGGSGGGVPNEKHGSSAFQLKFPMPLATRGLVLVLPLLSLSSLQFGVNGLEGHYLCTIGPSLFSHYLCQTLIPGQPQIDKGTNGHKAHSYPSWLCSPCVSLGHSPLPFGYFSILLIADVQGLCQQVAKANKGNRAESAEGQERRAGGRERPAQGISL